MGGGPAPDEDGDLRLSSDGSVVLVTRRHPPAADRSADECVLVWSKSAVYAHPSTYTKDNIPGFLAIVRNDGRPMLCWLPTSVLLDDERDQFLAVEMTQDDGPRASPLPEAEAVSIRPPSRSGADHSFALPINQLYSLIVRPPTITSWYGSVTVTSGGVSSVCLYFHDEESPSTVFSRDRRARLGAAADEADAPPAWGGEALVKQLRKYADVVRSSIEPSVFLVNPSRADLDAHSMPAFDELEVLPPALREAARKSRRRSVLHEALAPEIRKQESASSSSSSPTMSSTTFGILNSFSKITRNARTAAQAVAQPILSHRLARPILPHLPPPLANMAQAKPEWVQWEEAAGMEGFSTARVYLAKWARIVSEEGERARREEIGAGDDGEEASALGAFEVLAGEQSKYSIARPRTTRATHHPIVETEWSAWFDGDGTLMLSESEARKRIFQRGLNAPTRKMAWPFLLGVFPWDSTTSQRAQIMRDRSVEYERLKASWRDDPSINESEAFIEENHRIDIDCRRTDRNQPMFAAECNENPGDEEMAASQSPQPSTSRTGLADGQATSNPHIRQMQQILLTYNAFETDLGYVQGMSDLCSPLYISLDGDEVLVFWCFVHFMERMKPNFYRDQSGMRDQLSLLQKLISVMDQPLHRHLERTDSLNLFFAFRWILIAFKREFPLEQTCLIWETLWTEHYGRFFHLFIAVAILQAHRDVIMRYLLTFDEVLKYINELSMTIEAEPMLCQAEVAALTFREIVELADRHRAEAADATTSDTTGLRRRAEADDDAARESHDAADDTLTRFEIDQELRILLPSA